MTTQQLIETYPEDWQPAAKVANVDPNFYEVIWNDDFTMFSTRKLFWHNEASYASYQGDDTEYEPDDDLILEPIYKANPLDIDCNIDF